MYSVGATCKACYPGSHERLGHAAPAYDIGYDGITTFRISIARKCSFSQRIINAWNILSNNCVNATSVNIIKNKIDSYPASAGYTYM